MITLTRLQRVALKAVYDRQPLEIVVEAFPDKSIYPAITYRAFRKTVQPEVCGPAIMVPWCGMWIGKERDGHTHS